MKRRKVYIYALLDPYTDQIRYIGKTFTLKRRYKDHLKYNESDPNRHKRNWLRKLIAKNKPPLFKILEVTIPSLSWKKERKWIKKYRKIGALVNIADGGGGIHNPSKKLRAKMSASQKKYWKSLSKKERNKKIKKLKNMARDPLIKAALKKYKLGRKQSSSTKKKISKKLTGIRRSIFTKNKMSRSKKKLMKKIAKHVHIVNMRGIRKGIKNRNSTSKYLGVSYTQEGRRNKHWSSFIYNKGTRIFIGRYKTEIDAARAYNIKAIDIFKNGAKLNKIKLFSYEKYKHLIP